MYFTSLFWNKAIQCYSIELHTIVLQDCLMVSRQRCVAIGWQINSDREVPGPLTNLSVVQVLVQVISQISDIDISDIGVWDIDFRCVPGPLTNLSVVQVLVQVISQIWDIVIWDIDVWDIDISDIDTIVLQDCLMVSQQRCVAIGWQINSDRDVLYIPSEMYHISMSDQVRQRYIIHPEKDVSYISLSLCSYAVLISYSTI